VPDIEKTSLERDRAPLSGIEELLLSLVALICYLLLAWYHLDLVVAAVLLPFILTIGVLRIALGKKNFELFFLHTPPPISDSAPPPIVGSAPPAIDDRSPSSGSTDKTRADG
jgi:hypothetical protein